MFLGRVFSRFYFRHHNIFPSSFVTEAEKFGWSFVFEMFVAKEVAEKITQSVKGKFWGSPLTMLTRICASLGSRMKFKTLCYPVFEINKNTALPSF